MAAFNIWALVFLSSFMVVGCLTGGNGAGSKDKDPDPPPEIPQVDYTKRKVILKTAFSYSAEDSSSTIDYYEYFPVCTDSGVVYDSLGYSQYYEFKGNTLKLWSFNRCEAWVYESEEGLPFEGDWISVNSQTGAIPEGFEVSSLCDSISPPDTFQVNNMLETFSFENDSMYSVIEANLCELASFTDWVVLEEFNFMYDVFVDSVPDISNALGLLSQNLQFQDKSCQSYELFLRSRKATVVNHYNLDGEGVVSGEHYEFSYNNLKCEVDIDYRTLPQCEELDPWVEFLACIYLTDFFPLESAILESRNQSTAPLGKKLVLSDFKKYEGTQNQRKKRHQMKAPYNF